MTSKKKSKSVERTKPDKSKKKEEPQPEIIQVKQPLSKGNQNANSNKNNQVVQIIFPPDTELRKVKKKKKGKSSATKKKEKEREELLNQLKQKLEEYDTIQQEAQKRQIKIPEALGIKVINQGDLKTNEDIQNYINDVVKKIAQLQQLVQQSQASSSAGMPIRLGAGITQFPTLPSQRDMNAPPVVIPPSQPQRPIIPQQPDKTKQELDKIAKDIQDRIDSGGGGYAPFNPSQPSQPSVPGSQIPIKEGDLIESKGLQYGNQRIDVKAPKGWEELFTRYRQYLESVSYDTAQGQVLQGVYHIPLDKENDLFKARDTLKNDYLEWFNGLDRNLNAYILDPKNQVLNSVHIEMGQDLNMRPQDLAKKLFRQQGIKFTEITGGNEMPKIEQRIQQGGQNPYTDEKDNKAYQEYMSVLNDKTNKLMNIRQEIQSIEASGSAPAQSKLDDLFKRINKLEDEISSVYNGLTPNVKLGVMTANDKLHKRFNDERQAIGNIQNPPSTPVRPDVPDPSILPTLSENGAIENLKVFVNAERPQYNQKIRASVLQLFGDSFYKALEDDTPAVRRQNIATKFIEYMRTKDPEWSPNNPADRPNANPRRMIDPPTHSQPPFLQPTMDADGIMRFHNQGGDIGGSFMF